LRVATPPMLRPREPEPVRAESSADPLVSITVAILGFIALALFVAAVLAVYTYSTPGVELPLVIGISLGFSALMLLNLFRLAMRRVRAKH
jgi:hypothetical protein